MKRWNSNRLRSPDDAGRGGRRPWIIRKLDRAINGKPPKPPKKKPIRELTEYQRLTRIDVDPETMLKREKPQG